MHYGLFEGIEIDIQHLAQAQENYAQFLFSTIPDGVKTILDVGCGSGRMAHTLLEKGYQVDCVSPGTLLTNYVKETIGNRIELYNCKFEELKTTKKYDLVMFSESFQYIPMDRSIPGALDVLNPGGFIIVSDFFQTDEPGKSPMGGGHKFTEWGKKKAKFNLKQLKERDITKETAPTFDLVNQMTMEFLYPIWNVVFKLAEDRFPWVIKFIRWKYKKKLSKMENKHFQGQRTGANFARYKKYMFYLFQSP
ncbi:MAG: class I SAM-dependent methyltransferase [Bacteroidota bacterium]